MPDDLTLAQPSPRFVRSAARLLALLLGAAMLASLAVAASARAEEQLTLLYFGADGCPYCAQMEVFLDELEGRYGDELVIERYEVSRDVAARDRWVAELAARGQQASGVPTAILNDLVWVGYDARVAASVTAAVEAALATTAPEEPPPDDVMPGPDPPPVEPVPDDGTTIQVPILGPVDLAARSAVAATALIAFVDGFNPCSLWVLAVLLAMVLNAGAGRGRVLAVGGTFLLVTGLLYGAFIAGVFTVLGFIEHLDAIRFAVAALAITMGVINVKDWVAFKRGPSLTIPDRFKPRIYRGGRAIRDLDRPLPAVLGLTVVMAAGIALVELPCTAGFPVIWTGILRTQEVSGAAFAGLLALYLAIYIADELVLFAIAVATLRIGRFQETHGRTLKLVGGAVMLALGGVLILAPELMDDLAGVTLVILGAITVAVLLALLQRARNRSTTRSRNRSTSGSRNRSTTGSRDRSTSGSRDRSTSGSRNRSSSEERRR